jgi:CRP/FNR family cyclic AMP-dependent transcriptional regulator
LSERKLKQVFKPQNGAKIMLMQSKRLPSAPDEPLLGADRRKNNNGWHAFIAQIPCESPLSKPGRQNPRLSKWYPRGSLLFFEGELPGGVYVLCEGRAKVFITSAEGKTLVLRIAQPGEVLGMNATLSGGAYAATVETLERCRVDFITRADVLKLLDRDKLACLNLAHALSSKLRDSVEHTRLLFLSQSATEKLARLLVRWCDNHGKRTTQGIRIDSSLTHEELAQMICASRETVTRVLGEFRRRNIVSLMDNAIFVRNRKALDWMAYGG